MTSWGADGSMSLFDMLQFHFHAPSEHTIDGKGFDLELHIVHKEHGGNGLAVLGIVFDRKAGGNIDNDFISSLNLGQPNSQVKSIPL